MEGTKPLLTEFSFHYRLESCESGICKKEHILFSLSAAYVVDAIKASSFETPFESIIKFLLEISYFQTASGVSSKVMDDYCWIHSTFHVRSEFQGNVGCILDTVLAGKDSVSSAAADTPDTAFYQWVPFTLIFQVSTLNCEL